jgi:uncharacterized protein
VVRVEIENQFEVAASPDRVYSFLLDVNRVATCVPGAELSEVVDPTTFKGKVRIKVGPITVSYNGTASISERDEAARTATLQAEGRETSGPGSARATARMSVADAGGGTSTVLLVTDYTVAGRIANFGRGVMEDVSKRLVSQMADCIKANLETAEAEPAPAEKETATEESGQPPESAESAAAPAAPAAPATPAAPAGPAAAPAATAPVAAARPVNALGLFFSVLWARIRRLFGGR